jgi:hypothetical protein
VAAVIYLPFFLQFVVVSLGYEAWAVLSGHRTITGEFRALQAEHPGPTAILTLAVGILFGHFFWAQ